MALYLLRHTRTSCSEAICYGALDVALADSFDDETLEILARCQNLAKLDHIYSSPLSRCHKLATCIAHKLNVPMVIDKRLVEMNFGHWQGKSWNDIPRQQIDDWAQDFVDYRGHGGESVSQLRTRVTEVLSSFASTDNCLIVSHAGFIRSALHLSQKLNLNQQAKDKALFEDERQLKVSYGELIDLKWDPSLPSQNIATRT